MRVLSSQSQTGHVNICSTFYLSQDSTTSCAKGKVLWRAGPSPSFEQGPPVMFQIDKGTPSWCTVTSWWFVYAKKTFIGLYLAVSGGKAPQGMNVSRESRNLTGVFYAWYYILWICAGGAVLKLDWSTWIFNIVFLFISQIGSSEKVCVENRLLCMVGDDRPLLRIPEVAHDVTWVTQADWSILGYRWWHGGRAIFRMRHSLGNTVTLPVLFAELWWIYANMERWKDECKSTMCWSLSK